MIRRRYQSLARRRTVGDREGIRRGRCRVSRIRPSRRGYGGAARGSRWCDRVSRSMESITSLTLPWRWPQRSRSSLADPTRAHSVRGAWLVPALGFGDDEAAADGRVGLAVDFDAVGGERGRFSVHSGATAGSSAATGRSRPRLCDLVGSAEPDAAGRAHRRETSLPSDRSRSSPGNSLRARVAPRSLCRVPRRLRPTIRKGRPGCPPPRRTHPTCAGRRRTGPRRASAHGVGTRRADADGEQLEHADGHVITIPVSEPRVFPRGPRRGCVGSESDEILSEVTIFPSDRRAEESARRVIDR